MTIQSSLLFAKRLIFPRMDKKSSARRSLLGALLCIGISIVPLVVVLSVANGMIEGITARIIGLSSSHLSVFLYDSEKTAHSEESVLHIAEKLKEIDGIKSSYPEIQGIGLASSAKGRTGAVIRAVPHDIFTENQSYSSLFKVIEGSVSLSDVEKSGGRATAVIGQKIASDLGLNVGSVLRLITTRSIAGRVVPRVTSFTVSAIVSCGYQELDAHWVFISLGSGFSILSGSSAQMSIKLETKDAFSSDLMRLSYEVQRKAGKNANVYRWDELNASEYENFASTKVLLLFIMLLIVLVASVNIFSALVMLSMERRREIAILKSFGATGHGITLSFLITGLATGLGGLLGGLPIGLAFSVNINKILLIIEKIVNFSAEILYLLQRGSLHGFSKITLLDPEYYLQVIPVSIPFFELAIIGMGTLVLSLAASIIPAVRAGKEKPLETLRKI